MSSAKSMKKEILEKLATKTLGRIIHEHTSLTSTNEWGHQRALEGGDDGETIIADEQTAGKGRCGRHWYSPLGRNLYMSVILRPDIKPAEAPQLTLVAGAAVSEALTQLTGQDIQLKWPNDLVYGQRKVGGILCEAAITRDKLQFVIIGIGLNIQMEASELPEDIQDIAISLQDIVKQPLSRSAVAVAVLNSLEAWCDRFKAGHWNEIVHWCDAHNVLKGNPVRLNSGSESFFGEAIGLDEEGHLVLSLENGERRSFLEGDVSLVREHRNSR